MLLTFGCLLSRPESDCFSFTDQPCEYPELITIDKDDVNVGTRALINLNLIWLRTIKHLIPDSICSVKIPYSEFAWNWTHAVLSIWEGYLKIHDWGSPIFQKYLYIFVYCEGARRAEHGYAGHFAMWLEQSRTRGIWSCQFNFPLNLWNSSSCKHKFKIQFDKTTFYVRSWWVIIRQLMVMVFNKNSVDSGSCWS